MREQRFALTYKMPNGTVKTCYPRTEAKKAENLALCEKYGYKVVSCKKLYPFSTMKNQHNFELIRNICYNTMYDMNTGEIEMNEAEYDRLEAMMQQAEKFFCLELPVAWLPYEELRLAKELANLAIMHRQDACIANGRPDLVTYC